MQCFPNRILMNILKNINEDIRLRVASSWSYGPPFIPQLLHPLTYSVFSSVVSSIGASCTLRCRWVPAFGCIYIFPQFPCVSPGFPKSNWFLSFLSSSPAAFHTLLVSVPITCPATLEFDFFRDCRYVPIQFVTWSSRPSCFVRISDRFSCSRFINVGLLRLFNSLRLRNAHKRALVLYVC